jgi:signal transduction histidine kinase
MRAVIGNNPETSGFLLTVSGIVVILTGVMLMLTAGFWNAFQKEIITNNIARIGKLVASHPELRDDIVPALTGPTNPAELRKGLAAARRFGYDITLPVTLNPLLHRYSNRSCWGILLFAFICLFTISGGACQTFKGIYRRIRATTTAAEKIVAGDFCHNLSEEHEGDLAKLGHQFNEMAKRLRLTLEQLQNEKLFLKNIIFDISHQLKTPLASIKLFNELLDEELAAAGPIPREFVAKTTSQIGRMEWLIKNLLLIAKMEAKAIEFRLTEQSVNDTVTEAIEALRPNWEEQSITVNLDADHADILLRHDRKWLGEAVSNLIKNSIEHSKAGDRITIELLETAVMVRIVVRDYGVGILPEDLPHIFERFYKGQNNLQGSGTGIGLALAKSIVENHGGLIRAESVLGKETELVMTFPKGSV